MNKEETEIRSYRTVRQIAEKWGLSERYAQKLLASGRVPGVIRMGRAYLAPWDAEKPADPRKTRHTPPQNTYLACGLLSAAVSMSLGDPDAALAKLKDEGRRAQYRAELNYLRGDFEAVKARYRSVSREDETYLCASNVAIAAAMSTGDYALYREIDASIRALAENARDEDTRRAASLLPAFAAVCMNAPALVPHWLARGDFASFPPEARPMLAFMYAKYLQSARDWTGMLAAARTAISIFARPEDATLTDIYLTHLCASALYALGRPDDARAYLQKTVSMCAPGGFVSPLGEYATSVGGMLEVELKQCDAAFERAVLGHVEATLKNWLSFHNEFARDNVSLLLTTREYQLALLLKEGKSYRQAGKQLYLSVGRIKNMVSTIYEKLGIVKKAELKQLIY